MAESLLPREGNTSPEMQTGDAAANQANSNRCISNLAGSSFTLNCARQESGPDKNEDRRNQREELDLVAQRDAANAAADSAWWAGWQFWASLAGLIGLGFTYYETRKTSMAAIAANHISEMTAKRQLRAYVLVEGAVRTQAPGAPHKFGVAVTIKNFGQTPARELKERVMIDVGDLPLTVKLADYSTLTQSSSVLGPGGTTLQIPVMKKLPMAVDKAIAAGQGAVYVYGEIKYLDIFDKPHVTNFKLMMTGQGLALGLFRACEDGNEYD